MVRCSSLLLLIPLYLTSFFNPEYVTLWTFKQRHSKMPKASLSIWWQSFIYISLIGQYSRSGWHNGKWIQNIDSSSVPLVRWILRNMLWFRNLLNTGPDLIELLIKGLKYGLGQFYEPGNMYWCFKSWVLYILVKSKCWKGNISKFHNEIKYSIMKF